MLGKLLKYELKATGRVFLPLYGMIILISFLSRIFDYTSFKFVGIIANIVLVSLFIALFVITILLLIQRFYKNLLGDEGYLMFTLPVNTVSLIWSKLIGFVVWLVSSLLCGLVSLWILLFARASMPSGESLISIAIQVFSKMKMTDFFFGLELLLTALVYLCTAVLMIYASMAIGQLFSSHRALASFGAYIGLYVCVQTLIGITMYIIYKLFPHFSEYMSSVTYGPKMNVLLLLIMLADTVLGTGFFLITHFILNRKLNLE